MDHEELVARECIRDVLARYNHAGDRGRLDELARCFSVDGVMELPDGELLKGRDGIASGLAGVVSSARERSARPLVRHHLASIRIEVEDEGAASVQAYYHVFTEVGLDHWGRYRDRFECRAGEWLIAHRRVSVDGATPASRMAAEYHVDA